MSLLIIIKILVKVKSLVVYRFSTRACHFASVNSLVDIERARAGFDSPPGSLYFSNRVDTRASLIFFLRSLPNIFTLLVDYYSSIL